MYSITLGRLFIAAGDEMAAEERFKIAVEISKETPTAAFIYGEFLLGKHRCTESLKLFETLRDEGWASPQGEDEYITWRVSKGLYRSLTELDRFDDVITLANTFSGNNTAAEQANTSAAFALIRQAGSEHGRNPSSAAEKLLTAAKRLGSQPTSDQKGLIGFWKNSLSYFFKECSHLIKQGNLSADVEKMLVECGKAVEPFLLEAFDRRQSSDRITPQNIVKIFRSLNFEENPFLTGKWSDFCGESEITKQGIKDLEEKGFSLGVITKVPNRDEVTFVFGETEKGSPVFIPRSCCVELDWLKWARLVPGASFAYERLEEGRGQLPVAKNVVIL